MQAATERPASARRYVTDLQQEGCQEEIPTTTSQHGASNCSQVPREQQHMLPGVKEISLFFGVKAGMMVIFIIGAIIKMGDGEMATYMVAIAIKG